jgi:hypothetical protein
MCHRLYWTSPTSIHADGRYWYLLCGRSVGCISRSLHGWSHRSSERCNGFAAHHIGLSFTLFGIVATHQSGTALELAGVGWR